MDPPWKHKSFADKAKSNSISQIVEQLKSSLAQSNSKAILSGHIILYKATPEISELLKCLSFGYIVFEKPCWFEFDFEEAFYLHHNLKSLNVVREGNSCALTEVELWDFIKSEQPKFPEFFKAYAHLRDKNWIVMKMTKYGGDFVAYRHHPKLIHSEYVVLVMIEDDEINNEGLKDWSDFHCRLRISASVAKKLLVLSVNRSRGDSSSPLCLEKFVVEESKIARLVPEESSGNTSSEK